MIVAGFGFRSAASAASLQDALGRAAGSHSVSALATVADKAEVSAFQELAQALDLPVVAVSEDALSAADTQTQSTASIRARGTGSVAEASALAAAGPNATLLVPRQISQDKRATCALAQAAPNATRGDIE